MIKIVLYLISFAASAYALSGVDFKKMTRSGGDSRMFLLYLLTSMGLAFLIAEFLLGLSL